MNHLRCLQSCAGASLLLLALTGAADAEFVPGNILVTDQFANRLTEFTRAGMRVQQLGVPEVGDFQVRDLVVDDRGHVHLYNGTFRPALSTYNPRTAAWSHRGHPGWSTINNISYGGIGVYQDFVYATDMWTFGGEASGIIRFNRNNLTSERFHDGADFIDLTVGLNGRLYALRGSVTVFDPLSMTRLETIGLGGPGDKRAIAVNGSGHIFAADWDGFISRFSPEGMLLGRINAGVGSLTDIDVAEDGQIVVGTRSGAVVLTDEALTGVRTFQTGGGTNFVAFVPQPAAVPEPASLILAGIGFLCITGIRMRKTGRKGPPAKAAA